MSTTLLSFSSDNGIALGTSNPISNCILSVKPLVLQSQNLIDNTSESAKNGEAQLIFTDSNNNRIGWFGEYFFGNEYQALSMFAQREISDTDYFNGFYLGIDFNGNPSITFHSLECKKAWQQALQPDILYDVTTLADMTLPITLSASAANYDHMRIYYSNSMVVSSVDVFNPNGKTIDLFNGGTGNDSGLFWPQATQVRIQDNIIRVDGDNGTNTYYMDTSSSTATTRTTTCRSTIYIYCVEAW